jgi:hypothetical protein
MKDIFIDFNVKFGLEKLWKWKIWILAALVVTAAVAYLLSLRMPNEYKATASFIPPHLNSLTMLTFDNNGEKYRGFVVGSEEDLDRGVEYLTSYHVIDSLAKSHGLYEHYKINMKNPNKDKLFYHVYETKNKVNFSDNSVVTITCYDTEPAKAHEMAQALMTTADMFYEKVSRRKEGMEYVAHLVDSLQKRENQIMDSLAMMRTKYGIYVMNNEGDGVSAVLAERMRNKPEFSLYYDRLRYLEFDLSATFHLRHDKSVELTLRRDNMVKFPTLSTIVQRPVMPTFKARPKRSIIVALAAGSMLLFSCLLVLLLDRSKDKLPI